MSYVTNLPKFTTSNTLSALSSDVVHSNRPSGLADMSRILPNGNVESEGGREEGTEGRGKERREKEGRRGHWS